LRGVSASEAETETSPGVLLSSGYIAGGTLCGLLIAMFAVLPKDFNDALNLGQYLPSDYNLKGSPWPKIVALIAFSALALILFVVGIKKSEDLAENGLPPETDNGQPPP
jgi:hypothetical protein